MGDQQQPHVRGQVPMFTQYPEIVVRVPAVAGPALVATAVRRALKGAGKVDAVAPFAKAVAQYPRDGAHVRRVASEWVTLAPERPEVDNTGYSDRWEDPRDTFGGWADAGEATP